MPCPGSQVECQPIRWPLWSPLAPCPGGDSHQSRVTLTHMRVQSLLLLSLLLSPTEVPHGKHLSWGHPVGPWDQQPPQGGGLGGRGPRTHTLTCRPRWREVEGGGAAWGPSASRTQWSHWPGRLGASQAPWRPPPLPGAGPSSLQNAPMTGQCHDGGPCHIFVPVTGIPIHGHCHQAQNKPGWQPPLH